MYMMNMNQDTVCPRSSVPFNILSYYIKWVSTTWTYRTLFFFTNIGIDYVIQSLGEINEPRAPCCC